MIMWEFSTQTTAPGSILLTAREIEAIDPCALMDVLGKRVIHPGGRRSTEELLRLGALCQERRVLTVDGAVATTTIEIAPLRCTRDCSRHRSVQVGATLAVCPT